MTRQPSDAGFTLIETLVALAVFAILAAGTTTLIGQSLRTRDAVSEATDAQTELTLARAILKDDLLSAVARPARNVFGGATPVSLSAGSVEADAPLLSLVRRGRANPGMAEDRTSLLYVEYRFENGTLVRRTRTRVDATPETPVSDRVLLTGLSAASFEIFGTSGWVDNWKAGDLTTGGLPIAVALVTDDAKVGPLRQLFLVSGEVRR